jgi:hypothetical protein
VLVEVSVAPLRREVRHRMKDLLYLDPHGATATRMYFGNRLRPRGRRGRADYPNDYIHEDERFEGTKPRIHSYEAIRMSYPVSQLEKTLPKIGRYDLWRTRRSPHRRSS